jgi:hypothetical protein
MEKVLKNTEYSSQKTACLAPAINGGGFGRKKVKNKI